MSIFSFSKKISRAEFIEPWITIHKNISRSLFIKFKNIFRYKDELDMLIAFKEVEYLVFWIIRQKLKENIIEDKILEIVRKGMREAVVSGSARYLYDLPVKVAGKTGTAQAPRNKKPHSWFTAFAPYENPEIVLTILIENGGEGSSVAVPIAKEVLKWYFNH